MSLKYKLVAAASAFALAFPAAAQVAGVDAGVQVGTPVGGAQAQVGAEAGTDAAATAADAAAQASVQAQTGTAAQGGAQTATDARTGTAAGGIRPATAADVRAGVIVQDPQGGVVGTVESVDAEGAVVSTGTVRAKMPVSSFGKNANGLVISMTRAQFEAAVSARDGS